MAFSTTYKEKIGNLEFLQFSFEGAGAVDWIRILDRKGRQVYFEDFNDVHNMAKPVIYKD